jgi:Rps23 Pro-64 3,4-dihydroxylase Tpa1-like proline 4-hydroxylase
MSTTHHTDIDVSIQGMFDNPRYSKLALEHAPRWKSAHPFPHAVIDDFLDETVAARLARDFPLPDDIEWVLRQNQNNVRRFQHDETKLSPLMRSILREMNSRQFLLFVETLTGLDNLLPDPYFIGGGPHLAGRGDFLNIHADFNWHHKLQAHRRVNVLVYLNPGWQEAWGGHLELWDQSMTRKVHSILPLFNRMVAFKVADDSNHGQPEPLQCPPGVYRKALNLYYYTTRRDETEITDPHFTMYKTQASPHAVELGEEYRRSAAEAT